MKTIIQFFVRNYKKLTYWYDSASFSLPLYKRYFGYVLRAHVRNAEALPHTEWLTNQFWVDCARDKCRLEKLTGKTKIAAKNDWDKKYCGEWTYQSRKRYF